MSSRTEQRKLVVNPLQWQLADIRQHAPHEVFHGLLDLGLRSILFASVVLHNVKPITGRALLYASCLGSSTLILKPANEAGAGRIDVHHPLQAASHALLLQN